MKNKNICALLIIASALYSFNCLAMTITTKAKQGAIRLKNVAAKQQSARYIITGGVKKEQGTSPKIQVRTEGTFSPTATDLMQKNAGKAYRAKAEEKANKVQTTIKRLRELSPNASAYEVLDVKEKTNISAITLRYNSLVKQIDSDIAIQYGLAGEEAAKIKDRVTDAYNELVEIKKLQSNKGPQEAQLKEKVNELQQNVLTQQEQEWFETTKKPVVRGYLPTPNDVQEAVALQKWLNAIDGDAKSWLCRFTFAFLFNAEYKKIIKTIDGLVLRKNGIVLGISNNWNPDFDTWVKALEESRKTIAGTRSFIKIVMHLEGVLNWIMAEEKFIEKLRGAKGEL